MNRVERKIWIRLVKEVMASQSFGDPGQGLLCRFAGVARLDHGLPEEPICMRCVLARYLYQNYLELGKDYEELLLIYAPISEECWMETAEANRSLVDEYCHILPRLSELKFKDKPIPISDEEIKRNTVIWCERIIDWLEKSLE